MQISGRWVSFDDGAVRPIVLVQVLGADGQGFDGDFLIDTGADHTVIGALLLHQLGLAVFDPPSGVALAGLVGKATRQRP